MENNLSFEEALACVIDYLADDESEDYECTPVARRAGHIWEAVCTLMSYPGVAEIRSRRLAEFCKWL